LVVGAVVGASAGGVGLLVQAVAMSKAVNEKMTMCL
jgi:hypothetical protein